MWRGGGDRGDNFSLECTLLTSFPDKEHIDRSLNRATQLDLRSGKELHPVRMFEWNLGTKATATLTSVGMSFALWCPGQLRTQVETTAAPSTVPYWCIVELQHHLGVICLTTIWKWGNNHVLPSICLRPCAYM